jgi:hypothetical protein
MTTTKIILTLAGGGKITATISAESGTEEADVAWTGPTSHLQGFYERTHAAHLELWLRSEAHRLHAMFHVETEGTYGLPE